MSIVPEGFVEVSYQGVVNVRGEDGNIPVILFKDEKERTMAVPLERLEAELLRHTLSGNNEGPQPYRSLLSCLDKLGVELGVVRILYNSEFDLPTRLILRPKSGQEIEVSISCGEGIACAQLAGAPIYVAEELMAAISVDSGQYSRSK